MNRIPSKAAFLGLVFAGLIGLPYRGHTSSDMFLSLTGISGEATNHLIAVSAFSWRLANADSGVVGVPSTPSFDDVSVTKWLDISSPLLALDCAKGQVITTGVLTMVDHASGNTYFTLTLGNVIISSISNGGSALDRPAENITLTFQTIEWKYVPLDSSGNTNGSPVIHSWNKAAVAGN